MVKGTRNHLQLHQLTFKLENPLNRTKNLKKRSRLMSNQTQCNFGREKLEQLLLPTRELTGT